MRPRQRCLPTTVLCAMAAAAILGTAACSSPGGTGLTVAGEGPEARQSPPPTAASTPHEGARSSSGESEVEVEQGPEGHGLAWTEVDLSAVFPDETGAPVQLESLGDERVLAVSFGLNGPSRALVTDNGVDWAEIGLPANLDLRNADFTGDRWVIQGIDDSREDPAFLVFMSDDEGATWTELAVDLSEIDGLVAVADAMAAGERVLVVAPSFPAPPDYPGADDGAAEPELGEGKVHILLSDGGPAQWTAELPGWYSGGFGASDGFYLLLSGTSEEYAMFSPDGRRWTKSDYDRDRSQHGKEVLWTEGQDGGRVRVERFDGVYGPEQVLARPEGVGAISDLAVGPPGAAAVGWPASPYEDPDGGFALPQVNIEKNGFELRYNQPPGSITLWDAAEGSAVYVLDLEALDNGELPPGIREIETDDGLSELVFEDPDQGEELVRFSTEELTVAFLESSEYADAFDPIDDIFELLVGWSEDGVAWVWQTDSDAFDIPEPAEGFLSLTRIDVAVGGDFVVAKTQTEESSVAVPEETPGESDYSPAPTRWFIARIG